MDGELLCMKRPSIVVEMLNILVAKNVLRMDLVSNYLSSRFIGLRNSNSLKRKSKDHI